MYAQHKDIFRDMTLFKIWNTSIKKFVDIDWVCSNLSNWIWELFLQGGGLELLAVTKLKYAIILYGKKHVHILFDEAALREGCCVSVLWS